MFAPMRRSRQELPEQECWDILNTCTSGVLAVLDTDDYPYAVPLSYVCTDGKIIFHGAVSGHKIEAIRHHGKASFCVTAQDRIISEKYTTAYCSVIAFGTIRVVEDDAEKQKYIELLGKKYAPNDSSEHLQEVIRNTWNALAIMELSISHLTGKEGSVLAAARHHAP